MSTTERTVLVAHADADLGESGRQLLHGVAGLRRTRHRVVVAVARDGPLAVELRRAGATVLLVPTVVLGRDPSRAPDAPMPLREGLAALFGAWRTLTRVRPAVVYTTSDDLPLWPLLSRARRRRTLVHLHRAGDDQVSRSWWRLLLLLTAHCVLVDSASAAETLRRRVPALAPRLEVVLDAVEPPSRTTPPREPLEAPLRLLYLGALTPAGGPDLLIEAAALLRARGCAVSVALLGSIAAGDVWYEEQLRELADPDGTEIELDLPEPHVAMYLARADVVVLPARTDGQSPIPALTGILALRPVITGDTDANREALARYRTVRLIELDDVEAVVEALDDLEDRWSQVIEQLSVSRETAVRRHAPGVYQDALVRLCDAEADPGSGADAPRPQT